MAQQFTNFHIALQKVYPPAENNTVKDWFTAFQQWALCSASSPGTGAVCDEESEESANEQAFDNFIGRYTLHESAFSEIEETKSNTCTYEDGYDRCLKPGRIYDPLNPGSFRFNFKLFELHIYRYVDIIRCKYNMFV